MKPIWFLLTWAAVSVPVQPLLAQAQPEAPAAVKPPAPKAKAFEISHGNLFEALRQFAAFRKLDLLIDPDVPNQSGLYAFKYTTWEKALEALLTSHGLSGEIKDGILRVRLASQAPSDRPQQAAALSNRPADSRTISVTVRPAPQGEALLSIQANEATRAEVLEALAKIERLIKTRTDQQPFHANWTLRPLKNPSKEKLETFSMEDISPSGLRALYP
jgi:hypothetical protein